MDYIKFLKNQFVVFPALFILIAGAGVGMYFYQKIQPEASKAQLNGDISQTVQATTQEENAESSESAATEKEMSTERVLDEDSYSIIIPKGWVQAIIDSNRFLALVIKPNGPIESVDPSSIDYDTYYAVNNSKMEVSNLDEYVDLLKQSLAEQIPSIEFIRQTYGTISGRDSIYLESASQIDGNDYKTLLTFVDDGEWVWAISFNTLSGSWEKNKDIFYKVSNSLTIK